MSVSDDDSFRNVDEFLEDQAPNARTIHKAQDMFKVTDSVTEILLAIVIVYEGMAQDEEGPEHLYKAVRKFADWERKNL